MARSFTKTQKTPKESTANLGFEATLWPAADKLRNNMDAAEYKHVLQSVSTVLRQAELLCEDWVEATIA